MTPAGTPASSEHVPGRRPQPGLLEPYVRQWAMLLTTQRRDGTRVGTPVNVVADGDRLYFGTHATAGKVKRLRNVATVTIAPCTARGRVTGRTLEGEARLLEGAEAEAARRRLQRKYPVTHRVGVPIELLLRRTSGLHYEVSGLREPGTPPAGTPPAGSPPDGGPGRVE